MNVPWLGEGRTRPIRRLMSLPALVGIGLLALAAATPARAQETILQGTLTYDKVPVAAQGLRLSAIERKPLPPGVLVRFVAPGNKLGLPTVGQGLTDDTGSYRISLPITATTTGALLVSAQAENASVRTPTTGVLFAITTQNFSISPGTQNTLSLNIPDSSRFSGPFNILAVIVAANKRLRAALPDVVLPPVTVAWASNFRNGGDFRAPNIIELNGDRSVDSDEYDDSVIAHELGHFYHYALSRLDGRGGEHRLGDRLYPPSAFSEGWATGFGQMMLNNATYVDTFGSNGAQAYVVDHEPDAPFFDPSGYWSEYTVASVLWDLGKSTVGDPAIFRALVALRSVPYGNLIAYIDALVRDSRERAGVVDAVTAILTAHLIDYKPGVVPSVSNPFPTPLVVGQPLTGTLNSTVPADRADRENLYDASSVSTFTLSSPATVELLLQITASKTPNTSDLDLLLLDAQGNLVAFSAAANGVGGRERIFKALPAGTYYVEIWSFWYDSTVHYNSADFSLLLTLTA